MGGSPRVLRRRGRPPTPPRPRHAPAFSEWGQVLVDWQSQCAMNGPPRTASTPASSVSSPTAGCEADSSTVETAYERTVPPDVIDPAPADAGPALGSYSAGAESRRRRSRCRRTLPRLRRPRRRGRGFEPTRARSRATDVTPERRRRRGVRAGRHRRVEGVFTNRSTTPLRCARRAGGPNKWGEYPAKDRDEFTGEEWTGDGGDDTWDGFDGADVCMLPTGVWSATRGVGRRVTLEAGG